MPTTFYEGKELEIPYTLDDEDGAPMDADDLSILLQRGSNTAVAYTYGVDPEVTRSGTGRYLFRSHSLEAGFYRYSWQATGDVWDTEEGTFTIEPKLRVA